jgi:hypothetical protein
MFVLARGALLALASLSFCFSPSAEAAVFTAIGAAPGDIQASVDAFRAALGTNNGVGGTFASGRREINWDGTPNAFSAPNNLPGNFFNVNSPRGVVLSTPGTGLQVSANAGVAPTEFDNINATYSGLFQPFSAQRLFTAIGSNSVQVDFFIPGTNTPTFVSGFGAIFTDVNVATTTIFTLTLGNGANGGQFAVPTGPAGGLSFLGLTDPLGYSRIVITSGNSALGPNQSLPGVDVVAMDDFIYGEPFNPNLTSAVPEPGTLLLSAFGAALVLIAKKVRS